MVSEKSMVFEMKLNIYLKELDNLTKAQVDSFRQELKAFDIKILKEHKNVIRIEYEEKLFDKLAYFLRAHDMVDVIDKDFPGQVIDFSARDLGVEDIEVKSEARKDLSRFMK